MTLIICGRLAQFISLLLQKPHLPLPASKPVHMNQTTYGLEVLQYTGDIAVALGGASSVGEIEKIYAVTFHTEDSS